MNSTFKDKKVIVCGGSRGIGRSIALAYAQSGAAVSICARSPDSLAVTASELRDLGGKVHSAACDLADGPAVMSYVAAAAASLGGVDILINNASGFGRNDDEEGWAASVNVDLMASVRASHAALPFLEKTQGSIVHISSISGLTSSARTPPYGAVKAALIQYTKSQASVLAAKKIRVNCVAPGSIEFPGGVWDMARQNNPKLYAGILASIPFGRMGTPEEVAEVVLFLTSNAARWVTGQTLAVDGGQLL